MIIILFIIFAHFLNGNKNFNWARLIAKKCVFTLAIKRHVVEGLWPWAMAEASTANCDSMQQPMQTPSFASQVKMSRKFYVFQSIRHSQKKTTMMTTTKQNKDER